MQTIDFILGYFFSYVSEKYPPVIAEANPPTLTTPEFRVK
jgi:hypothetical protein